MNRELQRTPSTCRWLSYWLTSKTYKAIFSVLITMVFSACYYDNQEEMYPSLNPENFVVGTISFNSAVLPIMTQHCNQSTCHNSIDRASQIVLDNHADLLVSANDGSLLGSIRHTSPYSPMPKSAGKLDDCTIQKVATWIEQGALDN